MYCRIPTVSHSENGKTIESIKSVVPKDWGKGGMNKWSTEAFSSSETTLCDTIRVDKWWINYTQNMHK